MHIDIMADFHSDIPNAKDFSAQSGGSIGRAVWKWPDKSGFPGAFFASLVNIRRFISLPDLFPLALTNRPWVSEDEKVHRFLAFELLVAVTRQPQRFLVFSVCIRGTTILN